MKNKKSSILYVFIVFITLSCLFVAAPVLLKFDSFCNVVTKFFEGLRIQEYKNAYISAFGGMLGSGLAVTSAIYIQECAEEKQYTRIIRKSATIVYYDIKLFYEENKKLEGEIKKILKERNAKKRKRRFFALHNGGIHIDTDWISTVAELVNELDEKSIQDIYAFYGQVTELSKVINKCEQDVKNEYFKRALALLKNLEENYYPNGTVVKPYERALQQLNGLMQDRKIQRFQEVPRKNKEVQKM